MFTTLYQIIEQARQQQMDDDRKEILNPLSGYIQKKINANETIRLNFICTHNSRRSHLSQIWAQTMAFYFGIKNVFCYSGGTEATAVFPKIVETLTKQGFEIEKLSEANNPVYAVKYDANEAAVICFSKKYNDRFNPKESFGAIMTCDHADEGCPIVFGAEVRFPVKYEDPQKSDGTTEQSKIYAERSLQIAAEMLYVFSQINK